MPRHSGPLILAVLLAAAGCGGESAGTDDCRPDDEWYPRGRALTIADALERRPDGLVTVEGAFFYRDGERPRLCTSLAESYPPQCGEPSLAIEGLHNPLRAIEGLQVTGRDGLQRATPRVAWSEAGSAGGRLDGRVLRIEPACSSKRVIDHFDEETGQTLLLDGFLSNSELEHLNFDGLEDRRAVAARAREWGHFSIVVFLGDDRGVQEAFEQISDSVGDAAPVEPDGNGIVWHRDEPGWIALKEYADGGVVLEWLAGERKSTDERWNRLDEILSGL